MELIIGMLLRVLSYVVPFALRWYYTAQRLAKFMRVTVSSENEGLVVNCADIPEAHVWLEITNHSSFPVEILALSIDLLWGGKVGRFLSIARAEIKPHSSDRLFVETTLTTEQARKICAMSSQEKARLTIHVELQCRLRKFALIGREINTKNVSLRGCENV